MKIIIFILYYTLNSLKIYDIGDESEYHTSEFPSKTNPESQLFELKEELEQYKIDHGIKVINFISFKFIPHTLSLSSI